MKKILLIEDESRTRRLFLESLEAEGYYTIAAENGYIGIQQAQEHLPDLVICDIVLPEVDGYTVLTTLREEPSTAVIPFIFLTAKVFKADIRKGMELGADDYLTKPCTTDELLRAIAAQLKKQAALQQGYASKLQLCKEPLLAETQFLSESSQSLFPSTPQLKEVFDFIEANYQQPITLHDVAQAVGYSRTYLTNLVGSQTGKTVNRWIVEYRMAKARSLLLQTKDSVEQIAEAVGYQTVCHFFRQFRQHHGKTPHTWRKEQQTSFSSKHNRNNR